MREAALDLFSEKGFDRTTAAEIAEHAGVTERTFFRHFSDKREVLFNEVELGSKLSAAISEAPVELGPIEVVVWAYQSLASMFEENLPHAERGQAVIAQTPALQERQLAKAASITGTIADALRRRGINSLHADLAAVTGMGVTGHGLQCWVRDPSLPLVEHFEQALQAFKAISPSATKQTPRKKQKPAAEH
ncbi:TetR family transcriptional regulator [Agrobacterium salinitolerans]|uniref:TetR family transcriptional regulator n=1 Tax=Agrobacterium salinitolerans TaxID=1183413 RepID=UPI0015725D70|nr:TetR family transcriptional regulator [Agrobacterium salinitolerans]NTA40274.1 TetR family transcriptional regulator [Agrobacterium salinitolerans]